MPLFQRTTRSVSLTEVGAHLLARLRLATTEIGEALEELATLRQRPAGRLRLSVPRIALDLVILPVMPEFRCAYPNVKVEIDVDDTSVDLTAGRFRDGAVARVLAMEFWTRGEAPTFEEFARSWTKAKAEDHRLLTPEYAYLTDLRHQRADGNWKALRKAKANAALDKLATIVPVRAADRRLFR